MVTTTLRSVVSEKLRDSIEDHYGPQNNYDGTKYVYKDLHLNEPLGKVALLDAIDMAVKSLGIKPRKFMGELKPDENRDYTISEIEDIITREAERQGIRL